MIKYNVSSLSGTFADVASASSVSGNVVKMNRDYPKLDHLSALVTVLAETNTFTIAPKWEVSNNNTTFVAAAPSNNAANVVIATGTAGADTAVSAAVTAPDSVYAWQYARLSLVAGGTTGTSSDTYAIGYCFRELTGVDS